jgi:hypothetical protein
MSKEFLALIAMPVQFKLPFFVTVQVGVRWLAETEPTI